MPYSMARAGTWKHTLFVRPNISHSMQTRRTTSRDLWVQPPKCQDPAWQPCRCLVAVLGSLYDPSLVLGDNLTTALTIPENLPQDNLILLGRRYASESPTRWLEVVLFELV